MLLKVFRGMRRDQHVKVGAWEMSRLNPKPKAEEN